MENQLQKTYPRESTKKTSAEDMQDAIFRKMSADKKIEVAAKLWLLGKALAGDKIDYGRDGSEAAARKDS